MMAQRTDQLPYGVWKFSRGWYLLVLLLLAIVGGAIYAYSVQLREGLVVTGLRDWGTMGGAPWGLYIAFFVYFVGVGFAGIVVAALIRLFRIEPLKPLSRAAELMAIIALLMGAISVLPDVGQPLRALLYLPFYGRPQSPLYGDLTMIVGGYLIASLIYFYLEGRRDAAWMAEHAPRLRWFYRLWAAGYRGTPEERRRHELTSFILAIAILPILVMAYPTGFILGLMGSRPGWFSALQAPSFVLMAGVSGVGTLIVIAALLRKTLGLRALITEQTFNWLGLFLMALTIVYLYFMGVELFTHLYAGPLPEWEVTRALLVGGYAWLYWGVVASLLGSVLLIALSRLRRLSRYSIAATVAAGVLVNLAAIAKRIVILVPSLTHGALLPYGEGAYSPTWVEYAVIAGLFALGTLLYVLFIKIFPIVEVAPEEKHPAREVTPTALGRPKVSARGFAAIAMVVLGLALVIIAFFFFGAPWGMPPMGPEYSNPRVPFSPIFVIMGLLLAFLAAVVYEVMPEKK